MDPRVTVVLVGIAVGAWGGTKIAHGVAKAGRAVGHEVHKVVHHKKHPPKKEQK